jgi:hypothetical protein
LPPYKNYLRELALNDRHENPTGKKYSPMTSSWNQAIEKPVAEIDLRHYSRKTLKHYYNAKRVKPSRGGEIVFIRNQPRRQLFP